jgi:hypothetical protein
MYDGFTQPALFTFGDCIPFKLAGAVVKSAQFNHAATCHLYTCVLTPLSFILPLGFWDCRHGFDHFFIL